MKTQWHPIFAQLLRPRVEKHFEMQLNVAVGELPREADILLLRRISTGIMPFQGLWRHLTPWNILEFKGPTVSPRRGDIDALVELGLGINRKLNEDRQQNGQPIIDPSDVSFWYLANHLGRRILRDFRLTLGELEAVSAGVWRCQVLRRTVFLISGRELPVEDDTLPLHIVSREAGATERVVAEFVAARADLCQDYGTWLKVLHPEAWKEIGIMATTKRKPLGIDVNALIEVVGLKAVVEAVGAERVLKELGEEEFLASLSPAQRRKLKELLK